MVDHCLYEIASKQCGAQSNWRIAVDKLQVRAGSKQMRKHFTALLRELVQSNHLPDYTRLIEDDQAVFWRPRSATAGSGFRHAPARGGAALGQHRPECLYIEWARDKDAARNEDARFIGWVTSHTKGKPAP